MKKTLQMVVMALVLLVPVLAYAAPCAMPAPSAKVPVAHDMSQPDVMGHPCPHQQPQATEPCGSTMSVGECLDVDMAPPAGAFGAKVVKPDVSFAVVLPPRMWEPVVPAFVQPRAPPHEGRVTVPKLSLILTTGRFRI